MVWQFLVVLLILTSTSSINVQRPFRKPESDGDQFYNVRTNDSISNLRKIRNSKYVPESFMNNKYRTSTRRPFWTSTKRFYDAFKTIQKRTPVNKTIPITNVSFPNITKSQKIQTDPTNQVDRQSTLQNITTKPYQMRKLNGDKISLSSFGVTEASVKCVNAPLSTELPIMDQMPLSSNKVDQVSSYTSIKVLPPSKKSLKTNTTMNLMKVVPASKKSLKTNNTMNPMKVVPPSIQKRTPVNKTIPIINVSFHNITKSQQIQAGPTNQVDLQLSLQNITKQRNRMRKLNGDQISLSSFGVTGASVKYVNASLSTELPIMDQMPLSSNKVDQVSSYKSIKALPPSKKSLKTNTTMNPMKVVPPSKKSLNTNTTMNPAMNVVPPSLKSLKTNTTMNPMKVVPPSIQKRIPVNKTIQITNVSFHNITKSQQIQAGPTNQVDLQLSLQNITKQRNRMRKLNGDQISLSSFGVTGASVKYVNASLSTELPIIHQMPLSSNKVDQESSYTNTTMNPTMKVVPPSLKSLKTNITMNPMKVVPPSKKSLKTNTTMNPMNVVLPSKTSLKTNTTMNSMESIVEKYINDSKKKLNIAIQKLVQNINFEERIVPKTRKVVNLKTNPTLLNMNGLTFKKNAIKETKTNLTNQSLSHLPSLNMKESIIFPEYIIIHDLGNTTDLNKSVAHPENDEKIIVKNSTYTMDSSQKLESKISYFGNKSDTRIHFMENMGVSPKTKLPSLNTDLPQSGFRNTSQEAKVSIKFDDVKDNVDHYITGQPVKISDRNEFEMVVLLVGYRNREVVAKFTGTLVAPQWILTAASSAKEDMLIYARSPNCPEKTCYNENIHKIYYHPEYLEIEDEENDMKLYCNNIAILQLRNPWRFKIHFAMMPSRFVPTKFHQLFQSCLSVNYDGYLFWDSHSNLNENHLTKMRVNILHPARYCTHMGFCENDECSSLYGYAYTMSSSIDNGICKRDVGSPLFCRSNNRWVLMGVRSSTNGCYLGFRYAGSSYTRVDSLSLWINYTLGIDHPYQYMFPYY